MSQLLRLRYHVLAAALLALLLLVGCDRTTPTVPTATLPAEPTAAATETATALPATETPLPYPIETGYPVGPGLVQAAPNMTRVTGELLSQTEAADSPGFVLLRIRVQDSQPVEGMNSMLTLEAGQEVDLLIRAEGVPKLNVGDTFTADVSLEGDERGQVLMIQQFIQP